MLDPVSGCFHAGTVPVGTAPAPGIDLTGEERGDEVVNPIPFLDAQTFTVLGLAWHSTYRNALDWRRPMSAGYERTVTAAAEAWRPPPSNRATPCLPSSSA
jgi:hypothetical protein